MEKQLEKELRFHMEQHAADLIARGTAREEAWRQAHLALGGMEQIKEDCRDARGTRWLEDCVRDLRYAVRTLGRTPAFSGLAILILALGIGANTAIFTVVDAVLLRPLPYHHPDSLVWITQVVRFNTADEITLTPDFLDWRARTQTFTHLAAFDHFTRNLSGVEEAASLKTVKASSDLLPLLGVQPVLGRNFTREEEQRGQDRVAILSHGLWQRIFGASPNILGYPITLDGEPYVVIGVLPADFQFPSHQEAELLVPFGRSIAAEVQRAQTVTFTRNVIGRLKTGVSLQQATAEIEVIQASLRLPSSFPPAIQIALRAEPLHAHMIGNVRRAVLTLLGAVGFLLLIACANVANLLLARAASRQREIAVRSALGGSRARLVRQLLTESLVLASAGCVTGLLIARWAKGLLLTLNPMHTPILARLDFDGRVLAFTVICSLLTALAFGLAPALISTRITLNESLKSASGAVSGNGRQRRWLHALATAEFALALILLTGAGLMLESFWRLRYTNLGFQPDRLLTAELQLAPSRYPNSDRQAAFFDRLLERLRSIPGVELAAVTDWQGLPPGSGLPTNSFGIEGRSFAAPGSRPIAQYPSVSPDYFRLMNIPLLSGRLILESDTNLSALVVVVSRTLADRYFPGENILGKRIRFGNSTDPWRTIVGVVGDVKSSGLAERPQPVIYQPYRQAGLREARVVLRTVIDPISIAAALRKELSLVDPDQPVANIQTMEERLTNSVAQPRFATVMLAIFATLAMVLSAAGIYGVMACMVARQTKEIGIRRALGAKPGDVLRMVLRQGLRITLAGLACGIAGSLALAQTLRGLLFEVSATNPVTLASVSIALSTVALIACYVPARRALDIDPTVALRHE